MTTYTVIAEKELPVIGKPGKKLRQGELYAGDGYFILIDKQNADSAAPMMENRSHKKWSKMIADIKILNGRARPKRSYNAEFKDHSSGCLCIDARCTDRFVPKR